MRSLDSQYVCEKCGPIHFENLAYGEGARILEDGLCDRCFSKSNDNVIWNYAIIVAAIVIALICIVLGGCTPKQTQKEADDIVSMTIENEKHTLSAHDYTAEVFYLNDGSRCVVFYKGGIDCDWKHFEEVVPGKSPMTLYEGQMMKVPL